MDARSTVTAKEGDRYPLGPPVLGFFQQIKNFSLDENESESC
jgi:hypothetical protein